MKHIKNTIKYIFSVCIYLILLIFSTPAAFIVSLFTREMEPELDEYSWGWIWGTYDNGPQGDRKYLSTHPETTGFKGYMNRVGWLRRNRLYGLKKKLSIPYSPVTIKGNPFISDKLKIGGWLFVYCDKGWEWYSVTPYTSKRCVRIRLGWKIKGDKYKEGSVAPLVFTINPFDTWGDD